MAPMSMTDSLSTVIFRIVCHYDVTQMYADFDRFYLWQTLNDL